MRATDAHRTPSSQAEAPKLHNSRLLFALYLCLSDVPELVADLGSYADPLLQIFENPEAEAAIIVGIIHVVFMRFESLHDFRNFPTQFSRPNSLQLFFPSQRRSPRFRRFDGRFPSVMCVSRFSLDIPT